MQKCWLIAAVAAAAYAQDRVVEGLRLLRELGCSNCHASKIQGPASGPVLTGVGTRLRRQWLEKAVYGQVSPKMPRIPRLSVQPLVQLLASSRLPAQPSASGQAERGRATYQRIGCVPCHGATPPSGAKFQPGAIAAFLRDPLAIRPAGTMPRFALSGQEADDLEAFLGPGASDNAVPAAPAASASRLFASAGCANCHRLEMNGQAIRPEVRAGSMESLATKLDRGCLDPANQSTPRYDLSASGREALSAALKAWGQVTPSQLAEARLLALNCSACHMRNGKGGPSQTSAAAFTEAEDTDLGDEGRFPPPLTAIGYKLTAEALRNAIRGNSKVHPKMAVRMPDFGAENAADLERLLTAADTPANFTPAPHDGRNANGRELVGTQGLGCINCHDLRGRKSLGIGASDLALAPQRLRPEWFRDFLIDPSHFHPGTRMPSFWPQGKATNRQVWRGDTARQIDSIWVYLNEIDQTRLPVGLEEKGAFELKVAEKAIVLRAFMKDAGMHAVAVGLPGGFNAAFDSNAARWALLWKGRFVDAESVWEDRFNPPMFPLGTDIVKLAEGLGSVTGQDQPGTLRFAGYRLAADGTPSFLYQILGARIADTLTVRNGVLLRTLDIDTPAPLRFSVPAIPGVRVRMLDREAAVELGPGRHTLRMEIAW